MKQVVNSNLRKVNDILSIYESIFKYNKLPSYGDLRISKSTLNRKTKLLRIDGIIENIGYGTWKIKKEIDIKKYISQTKQVVKVGLKATTPKAENFIRGHGFIVSFKLPKIKNWEKREEYLKRKDINVEPLKPSFKGCRIIVRKHKIWLCKNSIVIYTPRDKSYFSPSAKAAHKYAIYDIKRILQQVEKIFTTSFKRGHYYEFKLSRQHYANINNELAKQYNRSNKKLAIRKNGKIWLLADKSFTDELECIDKTHAVKDTDGVVSPFFNSLRKSPAYTPEFVLNSLGSLTENWKEYSENIKSHVEAIKQLGDQSAQQTKILNEFMLILKQKNKN